MQKTESHYLTSTKKMMTNKNYVFLKGFHGHQILSHIFIPK